MDDIISGSTAAPAQHVVDFDGDGKTDFAVVRNTGGGAGGQVTWFMNLNGTGVTNASEWGIASDFFVPVDYDGDDKSDIAVWRPGAATVELVRSTKLNGHRERGPGRSIWLDCKRLLNSR